MNLRHVGVVYRKELRDQLRDRRTLISMIVVPILLMPVLMFGLTALMVKLLQRAQRQAATLIPLLSLHPPPPPAPCSSPSRLRKPTSPRPKKSAGSAWAG